MIKLKKLLEKAKMEESNLHFSILKQPNVKYEIYGDMQTIVFNFENVSDKLKKKIISGAIKFCKMNVIFDFAENHSLNKMQKALKTLQIESSEILCERIIFRVSKSSSTQNLRYLIMIRQLVDHQNNKTILLDPTSDHLDIDLKSIHFILEKETMIKIILEQRINIPKRFQNDQIISFQALNNLKKFNMEDIVREQLPLYGKMNILINGSNIDMILFKAENRIIQVNNKSNSNDNKNKIIIQQFRNFTTSILTQLLSLASSLTYNIDNLKYINEFEVDSSYFYEQVDNFDKFCQYFIIENKQEKSIINSKHGILQVTTNNFKSNTQLASLQLSMAFKQVTILFNLPEEESDLSYVFLQMKNVSALESLKLSLLSLPHNNLINYSVQLALAVATSADIKTLCNFTVNYLENENDEKFRFEYNRKTNLLSLKLNFQSYEFFDCLQELQFPHKLSSPIVLKNLHITFPNTRPFYQNCNQSDEQNFVEQIFAILSKFFIEYQELQIQMSHYFYKNLKQLNQFKSIKMILLSETSMNYCLPDLEQSQNSRKVYFVKLSSSFLMSTKQLYQLFTQLPSLLSIQWIDSVTTQMKPLSDKINQFLLSKKLLILALKQKKQFPFTRNEAIFDMFQEYIF